MTKPYSSCFFSLFSTHPPPIFLFLIPFHLVSFLKVLKSNFPNLIPLHYLSCIFNVAAPEVGLVLCLVPFAFILIQQKVYHTLVKTSSFPNLAITFHVIPLSFDITVTKYVKWSTNLKVGCCSVSMSVTGTK